MVGEPDQLWLMLGEMRQQHKESAAERAVTRQMLAELRDKVDQLDDKFNSMKEERARALGGLAVIATIGSAGLTIAIEWIKARFV